MAYSKPLILTALLATLGVALFLATQQNAQEQKIAAHTASAPVIQLG